MSDADTRQQAEEHYYAALDLMADGKLEEAVAGVCVGHGRKFLAETGF